MVLDHVRDCLLKIIRNIHTKSMLICLVISLSYWEKKYNENKKD